MSEIGYALKGLKIIGAVVLGVFAVFFGVIGLGCVLPLFPIETVFALEVAVGMQYCVVNGGLYGLAALSVAGLFSLSVIVLSAVGKAAS